MELNSKEYTFFSIHSTRHYNNHVKFTELEENKWKIEIEYDFHLRSKDELIINLTDFETNNKISEKIKKFFNDNETTYDIIFFGYTGLLVANLFRYLALEFITKDTFYQKLNEVFNAQKDFVERYCKNFII